MKIFEGMTGFMVSFCNGFLRSNTETKYWANKQKLYDEFVEYSTQASIAAKGNANEVQGSPPRNSMAPKERPPLSNEERYEMMERAYGKEASSKRIP